MKRYEVILDFFDTLGTRRERKLYQGFFRKASPSRFACIWVKDIRPAQSLAPLAPSLVYLQQLGLYPFILVGQPDRGKGFSIQGGGKRDAAVETLFSLIAHHGGDAVWIQKDVFLNAGDGTQFEGKLIRKAIAQKKIPLIPFPSMGEGVPEAVVREMKPGKFIFLTAEGGIRDRKGSLVELINLRRDYEDLMKGRRLDAGMKRRLRIAGELMGSQFSREMSLSMTASSFLLKELFTVRGSGTMVRNGSEILSFSSWEKISRSRFRRLIETSFQKKLVKGYFQGEILRVFLEKNYRGSAVVRKFDGMDYLDKFAVHPVARGEGLSVDLWEEMIEESPRIFWRCREDNPCRGWYQDLSDGMRRGKGWFVFWKGFTQKEREAAFKIAVNLPMTIL